MLNLSNPDLTIHPPRSARVTLGGFVIFPRLIDKCRAEIAGKNGEYHYNCPLDQRFLSFVGVDAAAFKAQVAAGKGDGELLAWVRENGQVKRSGWEIAAWSAYQSSMAPGDAGSRGFFAGEAARCAASRTDVSTWFELLDVDDFASYGGKA
jgi:Domain of unknown function (DUF5069)